MEEGKKKVELDEFQLFMNQISTATNTIPNLNAEEFRPLSRDYMNRFNSSIVCFGGNTTIHSSGSIDKDPPTLSDDESLSSAFAQMSFGNGLGVKSAPDPSVNYSSLHNRSILHPIGASTSSSNGLNEFDLLPDHQNLDSVPPYSASRRLTNQYQMAHGQVVSEQDCMILQQRMYLQQLHNAREEARKQMQFSRSDNQHNHGFNSYQDFDLGSMGRRYPLDYLAQQNGKTRSNRHFLSQNEYCADPLSSFDATNLQSTSQTRFPQGYGSMNMGLHNIYLMAKDQHGCRDLQKKVVEGNSEAIRRIFFGIIGHIVELATHPFGNYLIQKLLEVCDEDQRNRILFGITRNNADLIRISCDTHGTRVIQKLVQTIRTQEQFALLVSTLRLGIVTLIKNTNGNHVIQRCLQFFEPEQNEFLFEAMANHCLELATDCHGCCVLQKCLSHCNDEQKFHLITAIASNAVELSQDLYGNYVVQYIFDLNLPWATMKILEQLKGHHWNLSVQKYSSNVIEKCLQFGGEEGRFQIVKELMNDPRFDQIMQDPYGNYVIQTAVKFSEGQLYEALARAIAPHARMLQNSPYGQKVLSLNRRRRHQ